MKGNTEILNLLINAGANLKKPNQLGETPLLIASRSGHSDCLEILVKHINPVGSRALAASVSCGYLDIAKLLIEGMKSHHDPADLSCLVTEQYNGKDVFTATSTEEEALSVVSLIPFEVLDKHLVYFASMAWTAVVSEVLSKETSVSLEGLGKTVENTTKQLSAWPKVLPGIPQDTIDCVVVDMQSKEKWHAEVCNRDQEEEEGMYLIRYDDGTKEKTLQCEIFYEDDKVAYEQKVEAWWNITRNVLIHMLDTYGPEGVSTAIRVNGTSDPVQNLLIALRTTCRSGLRFLFDGLTSGIEAVLDDRFASLAYRIKVQLCCPPEERTLTQLKDMDDELRLTHFTNLHIKYISDIFNESSLSMACRYGWVEAVERIVSLSQGPIEGNACTEVCQLLRPLLNTSQSTRFVGPLLPNDAALKEKNFLNLAKILDILILKGAKVEAKDLDTICAVKVRLETDDVLPQNSEINNNRIPIPITEEKPSLSSSNLNPLGVAEVSRRANSVKANSVKDSGCGSDEDDQDLNTDLINTTKVNSRWTVCVTRQHIIEVETGTKYILFQQNLQLGLLHLAAYHNDLECVKRLLADTRGEGADAEDAANSGCIPRDYTTRDDCHNILLQEEQSKNRIPNISDIDMVIGVSMEEVEMDISQLIANFIFGKKQLTQEQIASQMSTNEIKNTVESLGIGAFLWEPYESGVFIICNASLMRLELEARRSLLSFSKPVTSGPYEFSSGSRQYLVEHILNTCSGNLETWKCDCGTENNNTQPCSKCYKHAQEVISTELFLESLQADGSIKKIFGVHDSVERTELRSLWKYAPFSIMLDLLFEPYSPKQYAHATAIASYLGSKLSFYFLFVSFYLAWLVPLIITGSAFTFVQLYVGEVDNEYTLVNGVFTTVWAAFFTQRWKRKSSEFAFLFGTREYERLAIPSSVFLQSNKLRKTVVHPVTGLLEPDYNFWDRLPRMFASHFITAIMIGIVVGIMYQNILLRHYLDPTGEDVKMLIVSGIENAISVIIMDAIYSHVVVELCTWENHRTNEDFDRSLTVKAFGFRFVNGFSGLTYTALTETPKQLLIQLASLLVTQALLSAAKEKLLVGALLRYRTNKQKRDMQPDIDPELGSHPSTVANDEREAIMLEDSQKPTMGSRALFEDYSMIILQFSYVISFACVLPAAPVFAFIASYVELHGDLYKYLFLGQRSSPEKASGIGVWMQVLHIVTIISIFFNSIVIFRQGVSWKKHTWLVDFFTDNSTCQSIAGFLSIVLLLFLVNVIIATSISNTAHWVLNSELSQKFNTTRAKMKSTPTHKKSLVQQLESRLIQVTPRVEDQKKNQ